MKYTNELITDCVRETFSTPSGQVVLEWLRDLYVNYRSQALVQSQSVNLQTQMGYRLGSQDVVLYIQDVLENGLPPSGNQESTVEDELYE